MGVGGLALAVALALAGKPVAATGAAYDAKAGTLEAAGAAAADLRAPSAEIARVRAERTARTRAEKKLAAALATLARGLDDAARQARAAEAQVAEVRYGSDGSVELKLTLSVRGLDIK